MIPPRISRRTVLRGLGATMALPLLEAMLPTTALGEIVADLRAIAYPPWQPRPQARSVRLNSDKLAELLPSLGNLQPL